MSEHVLSARAAPGQARTREERRVGLAMVGFPALLLLVGGVSSLLDPRLGLLTGAWVVGWTQLVGL